MSPRYPIFEHWYKTLDWILGAIEKYPKNARFSIASRIGSISLDAMELLIEAIYTKNRKPILDQFNMQLEKLRIFFRLSHDRRYISTVQYGYISKAIDTAGKMAGGWKKS
ncbi:conserved hypothetical protein [Desulfamplus magnetovallimortis]|uniref:bAvd-like domain-containing protein n=1 Tax=Desulfamplus magnetovallimortis TaxID=1246637 RepID=A0A1W1H4S9_9BACT|nr:diversity-generating retroelement protein Avd [Desulfamplus magnetovallimortis]SLM27479.1 conserved hypothetical protein [Desulfamplus magnetovallimortis]